MRGALTRSWRGAALLACGLAMASVSAEEPKAEVVVEVVHASDSGNTVDPPSLAQMKEAFNRSGINYKSYRRLSREKLALHKGKKVEVRLPNGATASLLLKALSHGSAQVVAGVPPVETTYTLGREGSVFIQAGPHSGGMLILVLSPAQP